MITPSAFLSDHYRRLIGLQSEAMPTPLWPDDVIATAPRRNALTMVNPSPEKGMMFFARLVGQLAERRPDIPIEVYCSRGGASLLVQAAFLGGIDLAGHPALVFRDMEATPAAVFSRARVLIVPSVVEDAAPRVIAEALVNGVPPLGSDRGGIPEMCADAGWVLPIPRTVEHTRLHLPPASAVQVWVEMIVQLFDDEHLWHGDCERARRAGARYLPSAALPLYVEYFERLIARKRVP